MSEINPVTKDQLFEKKIAENTGSNYNVGDISDVVPVTKDQAFLKEIALNSAGQSGDISELEGKVADNTAAIEAIVNVTGAKNGCSIDLSRLKAINTLGMWSNNVYTLNGVTYTVESKKITVNADGSSNTSDSTFFIYDLESVFEVADRYTLSGCPANGSENTYCIVWRVGNKSDGSFISRTINAGQDVDVDKITSTQVLTLYIDIKANTVINADFYPMIRDARITDPTYVPYAMTNGELTERVTWKKVTTTKSSATYDVGVWNYSSYSIPTGYTPISVYFTGDEELAGQFAITLSVPGIVRFCNASNSQQTTALTYSVLCVKL